MYCKPKGKPADLAAILVNGGDPSKTARSVQQRPESAEATSTTALAFKKTLF